MKKHILTPDPAPAALSAPPPNFLLRAAEIFAVVLTALLPLKFASFVSAPEAGALYWSDPFALVIIAWPLPVFMTVSPILLGLTVCGAVFDRRLTLRPAFLRYAALWCILAGVSILGLAKASCGGYPVQMIAHTFSLAAYAVSLAVLLSARRGFARVLTGAVIVGAVLSIASGLHQYFRGFEDLREHVRVQSEAAGRPIVSSAYDIRIQEARIQADFASCNVYGAYLAALLPFLTALLWRFGNERVTPPKLSRRLLSGAALGIVGFLLVQTDSRGAVLSLTAAAAFLFFFMNPPKKLKLAGMGIIALGAAAVVVMIVAGRGSLSMFVRFDYVQSAFRMLLADPLTGTGWGDFLHDHMLFRLWRDKEAAHSPHNMIMLFASQCGIAGMAAAFGVLAYPVLASYRTARRAVCAGRSGVWMLLPVLPCLILTFASLLDIGFETTAYSGILIVFSLLTLDAAHPGGEYAPPARMRLALYPALILFAAAAFVWGWKMFRAEHAYAVLMDELDPRFSYEHSGDPDYVPPMDFVARLTYAAAEAAPGSPFPWAQAADYMFAAGRPDTALDWLGRAIALNPLQGAYRVKRACMTYSLAGQTVTDAVRTDLDEARRLAPNNPELDRPDLDICRGAFSQKEQ